MRVAAELAEGGDLLLRVTDTGIGIPEGDIERVFEPFTQLDTSLARRFQGSGLGLYVARALAAAHDGTLSLTSRVGQGTTALLRLPAGRLIHPPRPSAIAGAARAADTKGIAMTPIAVTDTLFFERPEAELAREDAARIVEDALHGADDGELYLEYRESEGLSLEDGRIRTASFDTTLGFGLRAVSGEEQGYAHAGELSEAALKRAAATVKAVRSGHSGAAGEPPRASNARLYTDANPLREMEFAERARLLAAIDTYARGKDPRVRQVMASIGGEWQAVQIMRADGTRFADLRPLVRLNVSVVVEVDGRRETGSYGTGGRFGYQQITTEAGWRAAVDEALRQALVNLESVPAPAGEMEVVLGSGWPGILLHEAIGHGLEGDFNRKKTSAFSGLVGQRIAAPGVTVVDDGTIPDRRGSLTVDDEGTPSGRTVMIEDGVLPRLHPGPAERPADGRAPDRQRPAAILRPRADAAHDQHGDARRAATARRR